jgi:hypothetical protein
MKDTTKQKGKNKGSSESKPKEDQKHSPVLWPETTEPPPTLKKPTKKAAQRNKL